VERLGIRLDVVLVLGVAWVAGGCMVPSMNVGRPVPRGNAAVSLAMGQTLGNATYVRVPYVDYADPGPYEEPGRVHLEASEGAGIPGSFTLGGRYSPLSGFDFGVEASFAHGGVNTRITLLDTDPVDLVLAADARIGFSRNYDVTSRLQAFLPFTQRQNVAFVAGVGGSAGVVRHYTWHGGDVMPKIKPMMRPEARAEGILGISFLRRRDGGELVVFADGYWIPWAKAPPALSASRIRPPDYGYEQTLGILFALSTTIPFVVDR
jgi:hypothetical protein